MYLGKKVLNIEVILKRTSYIFSQNMANPRVYLNYPLVDSFHRMYSHIAVANQTEVFVALDNVFF